MKYLIFLVSILFIAATVSAVWDPASDINNDGIVDIEDFSRLCMHWLEVEFVQVPDVEGMVYNDGEAAILSAELIVGTLSQRYHDSVPKGYIISQTPAGGENVSPGSEVDLLVSEGAVGDPLGMTWVYIEDDGSNMKDPSGNSIDGQGGFTGYMSKYETTNAQYCQYLNEAAASGDIKLVDGLITGADEQNDLVYYDTTNPSSQIAWSGEVFYVETFEGQDVTGFPVACLSYYGAKAFCDYYSWYRLPTDFEWQAAADFDGSYVYATGASIDFSKANYSGGGTFANPEGFSAFPYTSSAGYFGEFGYGLCDMSGNVCEWTDCGAVGNYKTLQGGGWSNDKIYCTVSLKIYQQKAFMSHNYGFRAALDE
ncbi:Serine/threonine-protein kinase pkn1 [Sedimentisphaera cyanobacteriorum]|uniref:Serine/threonine-protein kinase pkn1 n=1 Tax=Sedimentisphaera cyanobacteriorum TaxID=1940790 RepID=A0A1Q2HS21_9BACT|nr:SUMF1/EgtB/PvdO family nonheme iron enzyme [Sedimentisphaera cyanobacteriorum]AQQ10190.1 Serine/threonine-protein kinase pkn1 [Sedimentisphaera cyanobacteriorum]